MVLTEGTAHRRFLGFGLLAAWTSSFGQTFFIAFFSGELRAEFDLSYAQFGALYAGATFASGAFLTALGRQLDALALPQFTLLVGGALAGAACILAAAQSLWVLVIAVFLLRLCGQGLMSHIAVTSMARCFGARRSRAVAVAGLGFPLGEAVLPRLLVVVLLGLAGHPAAAWIFMLFAGLSAGTHGALTGTVFAELYGVLHLGGIHGAFRSAMIVATAAAPLLMGLLLDAGWSLTCLLLAGALLLSLALLPVFARSQSFKPISVEGN